MSMNPVMQRLVPNLRDLAVERRARLEQLKNAELENVKREDWVWHALLEAMASWGNNRGYYGLIRTPENYSKVTWDALQGVERHDRVVVIEEALRAGTVRMPEKKARFLDENFDRIEAMGGPAEAKRRLLGAPGRDGKMKFLRAFKGIGPKYARNVMMNLHDPDFRDSVAIDERIQKLSRAAGLEFETFDQHERFYLDVAEAAKLEGWEVDRLVFHFTDEVIARLGERSAGGPRRSCSRRQPDR